MRTPQVFIIVGGRSSGKTYFLEHTLKRSETVVIELVKTNRLDGYDKFYFQDFEEKKVNFKAIANKKIVFEDATSYISSNMKNGLKQLIVFSKQLGCDVFLVFHSVNIIPPFLWNLWNYLILFKCAKPRETATNKEWYNEILKEWQRIDKAKKYSYAVIASKI